MKERPRRRVGDWFDRAATRFGRWMSNPVTFLTVFTVVLAWTIAGFFFGFVGTWLSAMHMAGPVVTLLLVFLLQHGQAKNTRALQLKLDELVASQQGTRKSTIKAERGPTERIKELERGRGDARRGSDNVQDTPMGAQGRRKGDAFQRQRGKARRDPRQRRRRAVARTGPR
jgi:low affinity Fe/Cu permease